MTSLIAILALPLATYSSVEANDPLLLAEPAPVLTSPALAPVVEDRPEMEYTYVEANYIWTDDDGSGDSIDGGELIGSVELLLNFFVQGAYAHQEGGADLDAYRLGVGYHLPLTALFDLYGILSYGHVEVDGGGNADGPLGELGVRFLPTKRIELNARGLWDDVARSESGGGVGARFYFGEMFSIGARVDSVDSNETVAAGVRFEF